MGIGSSNQREVARAEQLDIGHWLGRRPARVVGVAQAYDALAYHCISPFTTTYQRYGPSWRLGMCICTTWNPTLKGCSRGHLFIYILRYKELTCQSCTVRLRGSNSLRGDKPPWNLVSLLGHTEQRVLEKVTIRSYPSFGLLESAQSSLYHHAMCHQICPEMTGYLSS